MTIEQTAKQIKAILDQSPYSWREIKEILMEMEEEEWDWDLIMAYSVAAEFLRNKKNERQKLLEKQFSKKIKDLSKRYL